jgi:hypothetical protein
VDASSVKLRTVSFFLLFYLSFAFIKLEYESGQQPCFGVPSSSRLHGVRAARL